MIPTLGAEELALDLLAVLACAALVPLLLGRLRVALIPGYLIAGVLVGPVLGIVRSAETVSGIASLASVLLMFTIGLHLDFRAMRAAARSLFVVGLGSTVATSAVLAAVGLAFGLNWRADLAIGMALAMSSTAAVLKLLQQRRELHRPHGRLSFGVLLMQDLAVVAVLAIIPLLEGGKSDPASSIGAADVILQLVVVASMLIVGRYGLTRVMVYAARVGGVELVLVVGAAVALGAAVATRAVGLSEELGAFVAGLVLAASPVRHQLSGQLAPLRDLFMAVFFATVGLRLEPAAIGDEWWVLLPAVPLLLIVKGGVIATTSWIGGASPAVAVRSGIILAEAGEFSLIVLVVIAGSGLIDEQTQALVIATVFTSLVITPALFEVSSRIGRLGGLSRMAPWIRASTFVEQQAGTDGDHGQPDIQVAIAGFGPVGRACAERFEKAGVSYSIIELNPRTVRTQSRLGRPIVYGDATNVAVLESAGLAHARALILTIPDEQAMLQACRAARSLSSDLFIAARSGVLSGALQAKEVGADLVAVDEIAAARAMSEDVLRELARRDQRGDFQT